jgi:hypothetical protein
VISAALAVKYDKGLGAFGLLLTGFDLLGAFKLPHCQLDPFSAPYRN